MITTRIDLTRLHIDTELRDDLCELLGLSKAISNWEVYEAVEMLYKFYKARKEPNG